MNISSFFHDILIILNLPTTCTTALFNMSATATITKPANTRLELRTAYGPVYRDVLPSPPRPATEAEIPVIDCSDLYGDLEARKRLAQKIKQAATTSGFFYLKHHGIDDKIITKARAQTYAFFKQSEDVKSRVSIRQSKYFNGWSATGTTHASPGESRGKDLCNGIRVEHH